MKEVYILCSKEWMTCQHTGLDEATQIIRVFTKKPSLPALSKHLKNLDGDMGTAISQVNTLITTGDLEVYEGHGYTLSKHQLEKD